MQNPLTLALSLNEGEGRKSRRMGGGESCKMGEEFWLSPNLRGSGGEGQGERKLEGVSEGPVEIGDIS